MQENAPFRLGAPTRRLLLAPLLSLACSYAVVSGGQLHEDRFESVVARTERAWGAEIPRPVNARVVTPAELRLRIDAALRQDWSESEIHAYREGLVSVGLWPADRDLLEEWIGVMGEEVAGLYLPTESAVFLVNDLDVPFSIRLASWFSRRDVMREFILAHELVHLLQHRAVPALLEPDPFWHSQDDAASAVQAALEGDAFLAGFQALEIAEPPPARVLEAADEDVTARGDAFADAPAILRLTLVFPYAQGYGLAYRERRPLLDDPPASTEQVLHPRKRREPFQVFDLRPLEAHLPAGCEAVHENSMGELFLSVLFRDLGSDPDPEIWQGWDGDRYLSVRCGEQREFVWITAWDSESDALEFAEAYADLAPTVAASADLSAAPELRRYAYEVQVWSPELAPLAEAAGELTRRSRVSSLSDLRAHYE